MNGQFLQENGTWSKSSSDHKKNPDFNENIWRRKKIINFQKNELGPASG